MENDKEFVPYEEALALKEIGYVESCFGQHFLFEGEAKPLLCYDEDQYHIINDNQDMVIEAIPAPLYQQAFRWFRENYDICSWVDKDKHGFSFMLYNRDYTTSIKDTYEEAELACLKELINQTTKT